MLVWSLRVTAKDLKKYIIAKIENKNIKMGERVNGKQEKLEQDK